MTKEKKFGLLKDEALIDLRAYGIAIKNMYYKDFTNLPKRKFLKKALTKFAESNLQYRKFVDELGQL